MSTLTARIAPVLLAVLSVAVLPAHAQEGTLTGTVIGADSEEPLPSVNVGIVDTPLGAATGEDGHFRITDVPVGTYTVKASLVGYSDVKREVQVRTGETTTLKIRLSQESVELSGITVTGRRGGYVPEEVTSATKTGAPLSETPQSVSVITRDQLAAKGYDRLSESLRYTAGVQSEAFGFEPRFTWLRFRGFDATKTGLYRNGLQLRNPAFAVGYSPEPYGAERIEVPKGPSSVLYGAGSPGGLVNFVSKKPTQEPFGEVMIEPGSFNRWQGKADVSGPIDDDGTFSYRLTGVVREADTQVDNIPNDRLFLAPAFSWRPSDTTTLTLLGRYQQDETRASQRLPVSGTLDSNPNGEIPVNRFLGDPTVDEYNRKQWSIGSLFSHDFSDAWSVEQKTRYYTIDVDDVTLFGGALQSDQRTLTRSLFESFGHLDGVTTDNQVQYDVSTGPADHTLLAGADVQWLRVTSDQNFGSAPSIDVFDPTYGKPMPTPTPYKDETITQRQIGIYLQDQLTLYEDWILTLNGRMDWARTETKSSGSTTEQSSSAFSGRAGLLYKSPIGLNPYVSYSESFLPLVGTGPNGKPYDPERGEQWELGAKYQPPGLNSYVTVALFDLTRKNSLLENTASPPQGKQTGEATSQGIEVEALASLGAGLDLTASYTRQDVEITESSNDAIEGERPVQIREQMGSLWVDYTVQRGILDGFGLGAGVRHLGDSYGDTPNTLKAPSVTLVDASAHYDWQGLRFQVNADNVLDNEYVASTFTLGSQGFATYGATRTITARLRYRW